MTVSELIESNKDIFVYVEIYVKTDLRSRDPFHTDAIDFLASGDDINTPVGDVYTCENAEVLIKDCEVIDYELMNNDEYNNRIEANSSFNTDFDELGFNKDDVFLIILVKVD